MTKKEESGWEWLILFLGQRGAWNFAHSTGNSASQGIHNKWCSINMKTITLKKYENNQ
jgi:hypothetical protein